MRRFLQSSLLACLLVALLVAVPGRCAADDAVKPDYKALVNDLFDSAATCKISGYHQEYKLNRIDFSTPDVQSLHKLRKIFLLEKPRYLGIDLPESLDRRNPCNLEFIWVDHQGKQLGHLTLLEQDKLILNDSMLFTTSAAETKNVALLMNVAGFASPEIAAERKLPKPDYQTMITAIFAKAASCKIEGWYDGHEPGDHADHKVDFTTPDAQSLLDLKKLFLFAKPRFLLNSDNYDIGSTYSSLHYTWFDAQGKELSHVSLLQGDRLIFENTHDIFSTASIEEDKMGHGNSTLRILTGRFALPQIYGKQAAKSSEVKRKR